MESLQRSINLRERLGTLRVRLLVASALALLGLTGVVGVTLHQVFERQARHDLRDRTTLLASGAAAMASRGGDLADWDLRWLERDPDFVSLRLLDAGGRLLRSFPRDAAVPGTAGAARPQGSGEPAIVERGSELVALAAVPEGASEFRGVEIHMSKIRLHRDLQNIRWLFGSIFLFAGAVFAALALYFTRGVVLPLEEIRRAAHRLVNGEPNVRIPVSGDREIDDIAHFVHSLAERANGAAITARTSFPASPRIESTHRPV